MTALATPQFNNLLSSRDYALAFVIPSGEDEEGSQTWIAMFDLACVINDHW
jgi:hypothetical protein